MLMHQLCPARISITHPGMHQLCPTHRRRSRSTHSLHATFGQYALLAGSGGWEEEWACVWMRWRGDLVGECGVVEGLGHRPLLLQPRHHLVCHTTHTHTHTGHTHTHTHMRLAPPLRPCSHTRSLLAQLAILRWLAGWLAGCKAGGAARSAPPLLPSLPLPASLAPSHLALPPCLLPWPPPLPSFCWLFRCRSPRCLSVALAASPPRHSLTPLSLLCGLLPSSSAHCSLPQPLPPLRLPPSGAHSRPSPRLRRGEGRRGAGRGSAGAGERGP